VIIARKIQMLYFHSTSEEIQKLATYAAKSVQLLEGFAAKPHDQGLCPGPRLGQTPIPPAYSPKISNVCYSPPSNGPNLGCLDESLA